MNHGGHIISHFVVVTASCNDFWNF